MLNERPILLVEDNPDDEALTLRAFNKNNIQNPVVIAHDGVEAVDFLFGTGTFTGRDTEEIPAFVLLDLKLPRIDGLEVLRRIRADSRTVLLPVIILSTSLEARDVQQAYLLGANSYIRKPVNYDDFIQTIGTLAKYWLAINRSIYSLQ